MGKKMKQAEAKVEDEKDLPGYPHYPDKEDIYKKEKKEPLEDEDTIDVKVPILMFPDRNWMIRMKRLVKKMKKTIITAWAEMNTMTWKKGRTINEKCY